MSQGKDRQLEHFLLDAFGLVPVDSVHPIECSPAFAPGLTSPHLQPEYAANIFPLAVLQK